MKKKTAKKTATRTASNIITFKQIRKVRTLIDALTDKTIDDAIVRRLLLEAMGNIGRACDRQRDNDAEVKLMQKENAKR